MAIKVTKSIVDERIVIKLDDSLKIISYDIDNAYPQRLVDYANGSGTLTACINARAKFIIGKGFQDLLFYKSKISKNGLTLDYLLKLIAKDYAQFNGYALHINYNALYKISSVSFLPFEFCRYGFPDDNGYISKIAVYEDWGRLRTRNISKNNIKYFNVYNPNPEVIQLQVDEAGGWENYNGQVYYFSSEFNSYSKALYHSRLKDCVTENEIMNYKFVATTSGFSEQVLFYYFGKFESDDERTNYLNSLKEWKGSNNAGGIALIDNITPESRPIIDKLSLEGADRRFQITEKTVTDNIRKIFLVPPVLIGDLVAGKLGTSQEIKEAIDFYNIITENERMKVSEDFKEIFSNFTTQINSSNNYEIIKYGI